MIVSCPECNGKVSTTAETCPHCGHSINPLKSAPPQSVKVDVKQESAGCLSGISQGMGIGCGCLLLLVVIALLMFFLLFGGHH
jgi:uncharacterized membrane protein YvbJ